MRVRHSTLAVGMLLGIVLGACGVYEPESLRGNPGEGEKGVGADEQRAPVAEGGLRILTEGEYTRTIHDLFGAEITIPKLSHDTAVNGWTTVGASSAAIAPTGSDDLENAAQEIAKQVFSEAKRESVAGCVPNGAAGDPCVKAFVEKWGRRIFRRPLVAEDVSGYVALAETTGKTLSDPWGGLEMTLSGMLLSPSFVYRLDATENDPTSSGMKRFTPFSMASRLSYLLWGSTPDDALLDAAEAGNLGTPEGVRTAVGRLLADPKAERGAVRFLEEWLDLDAIAQVEKDANLYPQLTPAIRADMREQIRLTVKDLVWDRGGSYLDLFDTRDVYMNASLAPFYGVAAPQGEGFSKVTLDGSQPRSGILGWAGILTLRSRPYASSPTLRGLFVRERVLCQTVPPAPADATQQQPQEANGVPLTTRQRAQARLDNPNCGSCHKRMDGIGLGLENFDAIGRYRTKEGETNIDASGQLDGVPFNGAADLTKVLRSHKDLPSCGVRNLLRYSLGRIEGAQDEGNVTALTAKFASVDYRMKSMLTELVVSDAFRRPGTLPQGGK